MKQGPAIRRGETVIGMASMGIVLAVVVLAMGIAVFGPRLILCAEPALDAGAYRELLEKTDAAAASIAEAVEAARPLKHVGEIVEPSHREPETPVEGLELTGVVWSQTHPLAFLNGIVVGVGETIGGYRILKIEPERVTVRTPAGKVKILALYDR